VFTRSFYWSTQEAKRRTRKHKRKEGRKEEWKTDGIEGKRKGIDEGNWVKKDMKQYRKMNIERNK
jgi:predicted transposase YdaD